MQSDPEGIGHRTEEDPGPRNASSPPCTSFSRRHCCSAAAAQSWEVNLALLGRFVVDDEWDDLEGGGVRADGVRRRGGIPHNRHRPDRPGEHGGADVRCRHRDAVGTGRDDS